MWSISFGWTITLVTLYHFLMTANGECDQNPANIASFCYFIWTPGYSIKFQLSINPCTKLRFAKREYSGEENDEVGKKGGISTKISHNFLDLPKGLKGRIFFSISVSFDDSQVYKFFFSHSAICTFFYWDFKATFLQLWVKFAIRPSPNLIPQSWRLLVGWLVGVVLKVRHLILLIIFPTRFLHLQQQQQQQQFGYFKKRS